MVGHNDRREKSQKNDSKTTIAAKITSQFAFKSAYAKFLQRNTYIHQDPAEMITYGALRWKSIPRAKKLKYISAAKKQLKRLKKFKRKTLAKKQKQSALDERVIVSAVPENLEPNDDVSAQDHSDSTKKSTNKLTKEMNLELLENVTNNKKKK